MRAGVCNVSRIKLHGRNIGGKVLRQRQFFYFPRFKDLGKLPGVEYREVLFSKGWRKYSVKRVGGSTQ